MPNLRPLVANHLGVDEGQLTPDARFEQDLHRDGIDIADLLVAIEDALDVRFDVDDETVLHGTYGRLEALVAEKCGETIR